MNYKDLAIYNAVASVAADIFKNNMPYLQPGKYAVSDFVKMKKSGRLYFDGLDENELIHFELDGFSCKFQAGQIFDILADLQTAWGINSGCRANFIKKADAAPVAVAFDVPQLAKTALNAVSAEKSDVLNSTKYLGVDTRRRALIGTNGKVLTAVSVPDMFINQDAQIKDQHPRANGVICADPVLFKAGKGLVKIDVNGNAANGTQTREIFKDYNFPAWETVCPAVSEDAAVLIGAPAFKEIKKAVSAAAKFSVSSVPVVILRAVPGVPELEIIGFRADYYDEKTAKETKIFKITLPAPVPFAFTFAINGKHFNAVPVAEKLYFQDNTRAAVFAAANTFSLLMPCDLDKTPWHEETFKAPAGVVSDIFAVCGFSVLYADNTPAALASVQDETAAPAEDAPAVEITETGTENDVYIKHNADFETPFYLDANGAPVAAEDARAAFEDEEAPAYFENLGAEDEETARAAFAAAKDAPAVQDEETAAPVAEDETETARAAFVEILARGRADQETAAAVAFAAAADSVPAEDETAPAVQDAAPVAVSLPVPVSAVYPLHAVYIDNVLHGVYFSKLLADAVLFDAFFAGRSVYPLQILSNETAPETENAAVLFAADSMPAVDEETAPAVQDEETAAPADSVPAADPVPAFASVFAIMPEIWETAAPAAEDETAAPADSVPFLDEETNGAPFAAEDAPAVAAFYLAANFARRARRVFSFAAALLSLLLITAAPRFIASVAVQETATAVQDAQPAPADSVPAAELRNSPETAPAVAADSLPADRMKQPRNARKRARRVNPDNLAPAVAVSLPVAADSVPADSVPFVAAADSVPFLETAAPADSVPAARSVAADSITAAPAEDAPAVQDAAPAAEDETAAPVAEDEETETNSAPADPVPADSVPAGNSPAPAVPVSSVAVPGCPGVPAALLLYLML